MLPKQSKFFATGDSWQSKVGRLPVGTTIGVNEIARLSRLSPRPCYVCGLLLSPTAESSRLLGQQEASTSSSLTLSVEPRLNTEVIQIARLLVETEPRVRISLSTFLRRGVFVLLISTVGPFKGFTTGFQELVYPRRWVGGSNLLAVLAFKAPLTDLNRIFDVCYVVDVLPLNDRGKFTYFSQVPSTPRTMRLR